MSVKFTEITLIAQSQDGLLAMLMLQLSDIGLVYRRCVTNYEYDGRVSLTFFCNVSETFDKKEIIKALESNSQINAVISISDAKSGLDDAVADSKDNQDTQTKLQPLRANDLITDDVIHIAHDRLSPLYGPTLTLLVSTAVKKSKRVGEFFLNLAEDLDEKQREEFLSGVVDLELLSVEST